VMATSMVSPSRDVSSSVTLLDNVSHYGAFFCRSPHSLRFAQNWEAPLTVQEQRMFSAEGLKVVPTFTKTQAMLNGRSANEQRARPGSSFQSFLLAPFRWRRCRPQSCCVDDHLINLGLSGDPNLDECAKASSTQRALQFCRSVELAEGSGECCCVRSRDSLKWDGDTIATSALATTLERFRRSKMQTWCHTAPYILLLFLEMEPEPLPPCEMKLCNVDRFSNNPMICRTRKRPRQGAAIHCRTI